MAERLQEKDKSQENKKQHDGGQDSSSSANNKNFWQKISEFPAIIFRKSDKESLLLSMKKIVDDCEIYGVISAEERRMIKRIVNIGAVKVNDVMTMRTDIVAIKDDMNLDGIKKVIINKEHSRIPVYQDNLDKIIGFVHSKDLVKFLCVITDDFRLSKIMRKIMYVPNSMRIIDLLLKMRSSRIHIAVVLDEYGGTDGLVTIEDIMEEIVGEIEDEYDAPDNDNIYTRIKKINENILHIGGRVEIKVIEDLLGKKIISEESGDDFDTVGGLILTRLKKVPEIGEIVKYEELGLIFKVLDADMRSVKLVEIIREERGFKNL